MRGGTLIVCPSCGYRWDAHSEATVQLCYRRWLLSVRRFAGVRPRGDAAASPSWTEPYYGARVA